MNNFGKVNTSKIENIKYPIKFQNTADAYVRPTDWLALPTVTAGEDKLVGLYAVYNESSNFVALACSGAYVVDWGDGVTDAQGSETTALHSYTYSDTDLDSTVTTGGYKMAKIIITPSSGAQLTSVNLQIKHTQSGLQKYNAQWLDIAASLPNCTDLRIGQNTPSTTGASNVNMYALEKFNLIQSKLTNGVNLFYNCTKLQEVVGLSLRETGVTDLSSASIDISTDYITSNAHGLSNGDPIIFKSVTTSTGITIDTIYYVISIATNSFQVSTTYGGSAVNFGGSNGTANIAIGPVFSNMFNSCYSLQTIPLINTSAGTNFSYMFNSCYSLQTIPLINTSVGTNFSSMFYNCYSLQTIPLINTSAGTNFSNMFYNCYSLQTIPLINTSAGTNFSGMFYNCYSLQTIPLINTSVGTDFSYMFRYCYSLQTIPLINTSAGTNFSNMFNSCYSLQTIPAISMAAATASGSYSNMFITCYSLQKISVVGIKYTFTVAGCKLSGTALDELYGNLATVTSQTITVTNNWGTSSDTPSIATGKGWTVTGS